MQYILNDDLFFRNFRYLRNRYSLSRRALAKLLHVSVYTVTAMEQNRWWNQVDAAILLRMAKIYDVAVNDLLTTDLSALENDVCQ